MIHTFLTSGGGTMLSADIVNRWWRTGSISLLTAVWLVG
jgi:hypothetical protein